ncbi:MAG TPA: ORF6N domain-containing protein [Pyrinomonadaceae bacterium]|nr:ORF6N domain-containing protein [Pyrinomonadaceae bacterium]
MAAKSYRSGRYAGSRSTQWRRQIGALSFRQSGKAQAIDSLGYDARPINLMIQSGLIPVERIERAIYLIRGAKVMLGRDLAALYGVQTKALKQAVRRKMDRFPRDFMFVLDATEFQIWRSQLVISNFKSPSSLFRPQHAR